MRSIIGRAFAAALALGAGVSVAHAQVPADFPNRPLRLITLTTAGGTLDILARMIADDISRQWGQPMMVENRVGAGGNIGAEATARSAPDGYTIGMVTVSSHGINPTLYGEQMRYDAVKDFAPIILAAETKNVIVVNPASPFNSMQDLVKAAKADPAKMLNYGSAGVGSPQHLAMEQLARIAGIKVQHINYRGTAPAVNDLLANQTHFGAYSLSSMLPLIQGKKLRVLAVMSEKRTALVPEVPTLAELGFPGVDSSIRFALFVPAGTPPDITARLAAANGKAIADPVLKESFLKAGYEVVTATPEQTAAMVRREFTMWGPVVTDLGLKPE